jgi:hypothetical protein
MLLRSDVSRPTGLLVSLTGQQLPLTTVSSICAYRTLTRRAARRQMFSLRAAGSDGLGIRISRDDEVTQVRARLDRRTAGSPLSGHDEAKGELSAPESVHGHARREPYALGTSRSPTPLRLCT